MSLIRNTQTHWFKRSALATALCCAMVRNVQAIQLNVGDESEVAENVDVTLGYAASIRAQDADRDGRLMAPNVNGESL